MNEGIVMYIYDTYAVVLSDKRYLRIKLKEEMRQGKTIFFTDQDIIQIVTRRNNRMFSFKKIIAIAACFVMFVTGGLFLTKDDIASSVVIDINPSVQLNLDKNEVVVSYEALNADAQTMDLSALKDQPLATALEHVTSEAVKNGFMNTTDLVDDFVLVSVISETEAADVKVKINEAKETGEVLKNVNLAVTEVTEQQAETAIQNNEPVGLVTVKEQVNTSEKVTVVEFFKDDKNKAAFKENGVVLEESADHELKRIEKAIDSLDIDEAQKETLKKDLVVAKELLESTISDYDLALKALEELKDSDDEEAIKAAERALEEAEEALDSIEDDYEYLEELKELMLNRLEGDLDEEDFEEAMNDIIEDIEESLEDEDEEAEDDDDEDEDVDEDDVDDEDDDDDDDADDDDADDDDADDDDADDDDADDDDADDDDADDDDADDDDADDDDSDDDDTDADDADDDDADDDDDSDEDDSDDEDSDVEDEADEDDATDDDAETEEADDDDEDDDADENDTDENDSDSEDSEEDETDEIEEDDDNEDDDNEVDDDNDDADDEDEDNDENEEDDDDNE